MGMYGDILGKLDDGIFVKIEPGRPVKLRILDHPYISQRQFPNGISTRFSWPVWDYEQQRCRILEQGKSVFKQIASTTESWPQGDFMPAPFDVVINRTGTSQFDTEYTVSAVPHAGTMPPSKDLDIPDKYKENGIPLQQVVEGKKVPVIASKTATETEQVAPKDETTTMPNGDVVIKDLPAGEVNLDDIPF